MTESPAILRQERSPAPLRLSARIKVTAGAGQLVESVSTAVFSTFLFFYYTAILGLPGFLVGAATAISLVIDAIADPLLGSLSDNARSRWGRRVPFMIIGGPLVALGLGLVFSPPAGLPTAGLFAWLVVMSLLMRFAVSTFHVPFLALGAELSEDYAERSSVVAFRTLFSIFGPLSVQVLGYGVFLGGAVGLRNPHGYAPLAWSAAAIITLGGVVSVLGVRRFAGGLPVANRNGAALHHRLLQELTEIFRNPSFRVMFSCSVLFYAAQGLAGNLSQYMFVFVWKISSQQILQIILWLYVGLMVGVPVAPILARRLEKKYIVIIGLLMFCVAQGGLSGLRALGIFSPTGDATLTPLGLNSFMAGIGLTMTGIAIGSMMADAADEHDFLFGTRREGLYFAGLGFAAKAATGLGALLAGLALDIIQFPKMAAAAGSAVRLTPQLLNNLTWASGPTAAAVSVVATSILFLYRIDRKRHAEIADVLKARKLARA
jgi:GPH family glycoside/pentoside/hexuronide:cation symporter